MRDFFKALQFYFGQSGQEWIDAEANVSFVSVKTLKVTIFSGDIDFEHVACQTPDRFLSIASCKDSTIGGLYTSEPKL